MIAIIGTKFSISYMKEALGYKNKGYDLKYFLYNTTQDMAEIFKNHNDIEGILFSGPIGVERFESIDERPIVPYTYTYFGDYIFSGLSFLDILLTYPRISPEKIYIDYFNLFKIENNNFYSSIPESFREKVKYYKFDKISDINSDEIQKDITNKYEKEEIEVALLAFFRDEEKLKEIGIPYKLEQNIFPHYIIAGFNKLIKQMEITSINRENIYTFALKTNDDLEDIKKNISMLYPKSTITKIKDEYIQFCIPSTEISYNEEKLRCKPFVILSKKFNISVGIGEGRNIIESEHNANEALKYSLGFGKGFCFILTCERYIIGPSSNKTSLKINEYELKALYQKSRKLGIKPFNLCRLIALFRLHEVVSTEEAADYLNIAHRSSNRILTILSENKIITEVKNNENNVGRPKKQYIKIDDI